MQLWRQQCSFIYIYSYTVATCYAIHYGDKLIYSPRMQEFFLHNIMQLWRQAIFIPMHARIFPTNYQESIL